jgi:hypothetical protein
MHFAIAIWAILAAVRWGDWKNFKQYYPTILYVICCDFLYKIFAVNSYHLWKLQEDFLLNHFSTFFMHVLITFPLSVFLYLSTYPTPVKKQVIHILKWVFIYIFVEWIAWKCGRISYYHGWNIWWSLFFDVIMFGMIRLHFVHYLWAIPLSIVFTFFFLIVFGYV